MSNARSLRAVTVVAALSMLAVACGQKPGVHVDGPAVVVAAPGGDGQVATPGGSADGGQLGTDGTGAGTGDAPSGGTAGSGQGAGGTGGATTPGDTGGATTPGTGGTSTGGDSTGGGSTGGGGTGGGTGGQQLTPTGSDRTGLTADVIKIGLHAPVTGAAPIPATSFEKSGDLYWDHIFKTEGQTLLGRSDVELTFRDDKYDPASARQVCRELEATTFIFAGGGGTDQIQACGQFAAVAQVPYFSAGVTEIGLEGNDWYFASSMTYRQQGILLAQYVARNFAGQNTAAIVTSTPNFDDAVAGWEQGVAASGVTYNGTLRHSKGDSSWYSTFANQLKNDGVEVIYILSSPADYIRFAQQASALDYHPQYVGVGISKGLNAVLTNGCDDVDGGIFFSPFPGLDWARQNRPQFFAAGESYGKPTDDLALALWGVAEQQHQLLQAYGATYGNDLTREDFRALVETQTIEAGVFPTVDFARNGHFGGTAIHVLKANCATTEHETLATFATSF